MLIRFSYVDQLFGETAEPTCLPGYDSRGGVDPGPNA
jgi:hypothetical protein